MYFNDNERGGKGRRKEAHPLNSVFLLDKSLKKCQDHFVKIKSQFKKGSSIEQHDYETTEI